MTLKEAIEILSKEVKHPYSHKKICRPDALKLGIEAMEELQACRPYSHALLKPLLPSETRD